MRNLCLVIVLIILCASCKKADTVQPAAAISALGCSSASALPVATADSIYSDTLTIPYTGGNGAIYESGAPVSSTGVTGLTATLQADTLMTGSGYLSYIIKGTPSESGVASFPISFGTKTCSINLPVDEKPINQYGTPFTGVPDPRDAIIYQVNMRAFSSTRNFQGVIDRLDSIKALGVNVIYLMPTYPVGLLKAINSPYCVKDYLGVNPEFGTLTDLRNLIEGAHNRGMAVIMDWVANHTSWDNAWITAHKDWYQQDGSGNILSPAGWNDVAQLNFTNSAMRKEMIRCMKYWVYTVNCDGFRCDYAEGPPNDFWSEAITSLRNIKSHSLLMLAESNNTSKYGAGFDYIFGFNFYGNLKSIYSSNVSVQTIDNINTNDYTGIVDSRQQVVRYLDNHDVGSSGTPLDWFGGKTGSMAAFVVDAYMKGVPMIFNGQEVGTSYPLYFITLGQTINWNVNQSMEEEYKNILAFRNSSLAIRRGLLRTYSTADICAFTKTNGTDMVLVISNLRNSTVNYTLPSTVANLSWTNALSGGSISLGSQISLQPYTYLVLKN
jgi:glycosidase